MDALSFSDLSVAYGMPTSHQAIIFRNFEVSYDSSFKLAGDYELLCRLCEKQVRSHTFEVTLATVEPNGVSHHLAHDYNLRFWQLEKVVSIQSCYTFFLRSSHHAFAKN